VKFHKLLNQNHNQNGERKMPHTTKKRAFTTDRDVDAFVKAIEKIEQARAVKAENGPELDNIVNRFNIVNRLKSDFDEVLCQDEDDEVEELDFNDDRRW